MSNNSKRLNFDPYESGRKITADRITPSNAFNTYSRYNWSKEKWNAFKHLTSLGRAIETLDSVIDTNEYGQTPLESALDNLEKQVTFDPAPVRTISYEIGSALDSSISEAIEALKGNGKSVVPDAAESEEEEEDEDETEQHFRAKQRLSYRTVMREDDHSHRAVNALGSTHHNQFDIPDISSVMEKIERGKRISIANEQRKLDFAYRNLTKTWTRPHQESYPLSHFFDLEHEGEADIDGLLYVKSKKFQQSKESDKPTRGERKFMQLASNLFGSSHKNKDEEFDGEGAETSIVERLLKEELQAFALLEAQNSQRDKRHQLPREPMNLLKEGKDLMEYLTLPSDAAESYLSNLRAGIRPIELFQAAPNLLHTENNQFTGSMEKSSVSMKNWLVNSLKQSLRSKGKIEGNASVKQSSPNENLSGLVFKRYVQAIMSSYPVVEGPFDWDYLDGSLNSKLIRRSELRNSKRENLFLLISHSIKRILTYDDSFSFSVDEGLIIFANYLSSHGGLISPFKLEPLISVPFSNHERLTLFKEQLSTQNCEIWNDLIKVSQRINFSPLEFARTFGPFLVQDKDKKDKIAQMERDFDFDSQGHLIEALCNKSSSLDGLLKSILNSERDGSALLDSLLNVCEETRRNEIIGHWIDIVDESSLPLVIKVVLDFEATQNVSFKDIINEQSSSSFAFERIFSRLQIYEDRICHSIVRTIERTCGINSATSEEANFSEYQLPDSKNTASQNSLISNASSTGSTTSKNVARRRILNFVNLLDIIFETITISLGNSNTISKTVLTLLQVVHEQANRRYADPRNPEILPAFLRSFWFGIGFIKLMENQLEATKRKKMSDYFRKDQSVLAFAMDWELKGQYRPFLAFKKTFMKKMDNHLTRLQANFYRHQWERNSREEERTSSNNASVGMADEKIALEPSLVQVRNLVASKRDLIVEYLLENEKRTLTSPVSQERWKIELEAINFFKSITSNLLNSTPSSQ